MTDDNDLWIRRFHPSPDSPARLICFPHAGGSASFYHPVSRALAGTADVCAVQYPGRQDRRTERSPDTITELADRVYAAVRPWMDRPTSFFGHSMGAVVAFEVARRLAGRDGIDPAVIFASGRRAPSCFRDERVHQRDDAGVIREIKSLSGTNADLLGDQEVLRMILPAIRSDYTAIETYRAEPRATVRAPIVALTGDADPKTTLDEARAWAQHTTGAFELQVFGGGHFYLADHQAAVIRLVADRMLAVDARQRLDGPVEAV